jgi:hypothetical protein
MSDQNPSADEPTPQEAGSADLAPVTPPAPPAQWPSPAQGAADMPAAVPPPVAPMPVAYAPAPPTSSNAIIAFVLSIVSWAVCPIVPAIVALVLAASAQREIAAGQGRVQGGGLVTAAKIISWINIGFWAAIVVIGGFFLALAVVAGAAGAA